MGASGSGKTTLLNALSGRLVVKSSGSKLEGEIFINNQSVLNIGAKHKKMLGYEHFSKLLIKIFLKWKKTRKFLPII